LKKVMTDNSVDISLTSTADSVSSGSDFWMILLSLFAL
jgi:hypothetical protein